MAASDVGLITNLVLEMYNSGQASRKWFLDTVSCVEREREILQRPSSKNYRIVLSLKYVTIHGGPVWGGNMTAILSFWMMAMALYNFLHGLGKLRNC